MSGHWVDASEKHFSEEVWTAPSGDSMIGMWRLVTDGKVRIFELLSLKQEGEGVVLRIRHFDPSFVSREEKTTPVALPLVERRERFARFTGPAVGSPGEVTLAYQREGETLTGTLTKGEKSQEFRFRLRKEAPRKRNAPGQRGPGARHRPGLSGPEKAGRASSSSARGT